MSYNEDEDALAPYEVEQYPDIYSSDEATPADPDVVDMPLDSIIDTPGPSQQGTQEIDVDRLNEVELLEAVMKRGCVRFSDGRMLTKCPCHSEAAICGLYSMPDPFGYDRMVCTGPVVAQDTKGGILSAKKTEYTVKPAKRSCSFHPDKLEEKPDSSSDSAWLGEW